MYFCEKEVNMKKIIILIQASSTSWSGGEDICMRNIDGNPAVLHTIDQASLYFPDYPITVIAPEFDRNGKLNTIIEDFNKQNGKQVNITFSHNDSPLSRMVAACEHLDDNDIVIRVDGIHFCFDHVATHNMLQRLISENLDCIKMPDDYPVHFTSEVFSVKALRKASDLLKVNSAENLAYRIHVKHYFFKPELNFNSEYYYPTKKYSDEHLINCREKTKVIYEIPRQEVNEHKIYAGDRLAYHYELASNFIHSHMKTLDIACADGYGVNKLSEKISFVDGADLDHESVLIANKNKTNSNSNFYTEDITKLSFIDNSYDAITCFETLEHVDEHACLTELKRVLRPNGVLVLSTPQNSQGHIPINSCHLVEYSLEQLINLTSQYFTIVNVIGIKAGIIHNAIDPVGTNTVLVCINNKK